MPANLERNTFVKGIITEANPLTFPENASIDENNFKLNRDGSRQRRLGMDYETDFTKAGTFSSVVLDRYALSGYAWKNVGNDPTVSLAVVQVGYDLWFFDLQAASVSGNIKNQGIALNLNLVYGVSSTDVLTFTAVNGVLIVASATSDPIKISYNSSTDSVSTDLIDIKIRDLYGVEDEVELTERPKTLSPEHEYNIKNQGWKFPEIQETRNSGHTAGYPSNADIIHQAKGSTGDYTTFLLARMFFGNTPAPKGKYIIDAFDRGSSRSSQTDGLVLHSDTELGRPSVVATFADRVFYSGIRSRVVNGDSKSPDYTGTIFFTQLVDSNDKLGKCYQEADPTSEHISDLVATDGGTLKIVGAQNILKMVAKETSLVVVAENGVWEVSGPDGIFKADDFSISQVSTIGAISSGSIVETETGLVYWSDSGIIQLSADSVTGRLSANNITESTIQTLYNDISSVAKLYSVGHYDSAERTVRWLYNDTDEYNGYTYRYKYNKELILDTVLGAFYIYEIGELDQTYPPFVCGYMPSENFTSLETIEAVYAGDDEVLYSSDPIVVSEFARTASTSKTKYITIVPDDMFPLALNRITFSNYKNLNFLDWESEDSVGIDSAAYLITGYELFQDSMRNKQVPYLMFHFKKTETGAEDPEETGNLTLVNQSSCLCRAYWGWHTSDGGNKWGRQFQAYRFRRTYTPYGVGDPIDIGDSVVTSKTRLRGTGKALSLRMDTEAGKDCHIYGWAMSVEGHSYV